MSLALWPARASLVANREPYEAPNKRMLKACFTVDPLNRKFSPVELSTADILHLIPLMYSCED